MNSYTLRACIAFAMLAHSLCHTGFEVPFSNDSSIYLCLRQHGFEFTIVRATNFDGTIVDHATTSLNAARSAGLDADIQFVPCRSLNATQQVTRLMNTIPSNLYGFIWILVQSNENKQCDWPQDGTGNCNYIKQLISAIKSRGKKPGINSSNSMWSKILGGVSGCSQISGQPLWYAFYDGSMNFEYFDPFGGWKKPYMKQYDIQVGLCGAQVDCEYYP